MNTKPAGFISSLLAVVAATMMVANAALAQPDSQWSYIVDRDEMRGVDANIALIASDTKLYGPGADGKEGVLTIAIRRRPGRRDDVLLITRGMVWSCSSDCTASAKFDDGPIKLYTLKRGEDITSGVRFVTDADNFIALVQTSKRVTIEIPVLRAGRQQFKFESIGGLSLPAS